MLTRRSALFVGPLIAFLFLAWFLLRGLSLNPREVPSPLIGKPAPAFSKPQLHDMEKRVAPADLLGRPWVLNVFASWCGPCRAEHPLVQKIADAKIAPVLGLNYKDPPDQARAWLRQLGDPYSVIAVDIDGRAGIDWGVYGVPETFVIDKAGVIRLKHIGPLTPEVLDGKLLPLLRELAQ
jgi:cytochrome c biogenesis protein CcmG/thiol:disulfide interchange protein DsbE